MLTSFRFASVPLDITRLQFLEECAIGVKRVSQRAQCACSIGACGKSAIGCSVLNLGDGLMDCRFHIRASSPSAALMGNITIT